MSAGVSQNGGTKKPNLQSRVLLEEKVGTHS